MSRPIPRTSRRPGAALGVIAASVALASAAPATPALAQAGVPRGGEVPEGKHPRITFDKKVHELGQLYQGEKRSLTVKFRNEGEAPLKIRKIKTTCGCTAVLLAERELAVGAEGQLKIDFDSKDKIGYQDLRVYLYTNDPREKDFGQYVSAVRMGAEVTSLWNVLPGAAYFGSAIVGQRAERKVRIALTDEKTGKFNVLKVESPRPWIQTTVAPVADQIGGGRPAVELTVTITERAPIGLVNEVLQVTTDHPKQPTVTVPVIATLTGEVIWAPEFLEFQRVRRGEGRERAIVIDRADNQPLLDVVGAEVVGPPGVDADALLGVELQEVIEDRRVEVLVEVKKDAPPGPFWATVRLLLRDPKQPVIEIPAFGIVEGLVRVDPPGVVIDRARLGEPVRLKLTRDDGAKLKVTAVEASGVGLKIEGDLDQAADALALVVRPTGEGGESGELVVTTDVPGEETIRLPVRVVGGEGGGEDGK